MQSELHVRMQSELQVLNASRAVVDTKMKTIVGIKFVADRTQHFQQDLK